MLFLCYLSVWVAVSPSNNKLATTRKIPRLSFLASSPFFGFILFKLKVTRPTVIKKATPNYFNVGV